MANRVTELRVVLPEESRANSFVWGELINALRHISAKLEADIEIVEIVERSDRIHPRDHCAVGDIRTESPFPPEDRSR